MSSVIPKTLILSAGLVLSTVVCQPASAAIGTWSNPATVTTTALTSTSGSNNLTWPGSAFSVGREIRLTTPVPGGFSTNSNFFVVFASGTTIRLSTTFGGTAIQATSSISNGAAQAYQSWQAAANWTGGTVADGIDAVATFTNAPVASVPGISLDGNITLGKILFSNDISSSDMSLVSGSSSSNTLTFATSDGTAPMIEVPFATNRLLNLGGTAVLKISGTQGLVFRSAPQTGTFTGSGLDAVAGGVTKNTRLTNVDWSGLSGGIAVDRGELAGQAANQLGNQDLTIGTGDSLANNQLAGFSFGNGDQNVGRLDGNELGRIWGGGTLRTLTVGNNNATGGNFAGVFGRNFAGTTSGVAINLAKTGSGTQTFSGRILGTGGVIVNDGTLLLNGTLNQGAGVNGGRCVISSAGTLGGTGSIIPSDTSGTLTAISVSGSLAPGDPAAGIGTLILDGANSVRPLLSIETGGILKIKLGAGLDSSRIAVTNGQPGDAKFSNNSIQFTDTTGGVLYAGQYILFQGDSGTSYTGLTTDANGVITAGLSIGSGLAAYPGSQLKLSGTNIILNLVSTYSPPAVALDSFKFGDTSAETSHSLDATGTVLNNSGGLGQSCRHLLMDTFLDFKLAVNPAAKNYLTIKLWGSDTSNKTIHLYKAGTTTSLPSTNHYGTNSVGGGYPVIMAPIYLNNSGVAPFPGRFYYVTLLVPDEIIDAGSSTASIRLGTETSATGQSAGIYAVYSGTDPFFEPGGSEVQGTPPVGLTPAAPPGVPTVISNLKTSLNAAFDTVASWQIYGSAWNGVTTSIDGTANTAAYSPVGAFYKNANAASPPNLNQIQTQMSGGNGVNMRIPSYLAKAYVLPWSNHYHDPAWLDRVVKSIDFCCIMQASNGGLSTYNGNTSTWVGAPNRVTGGNPLEGFGVQGIGLAFDTIYREALGDAAVNTLLQSYLNASITDGITTLTRREAWKAMFNKSVQFFLSDMGRGHATNQDLAQITGMWLQNQAAVQLGSTTSLSVPAALQYVYSATGLAATPLSADPALAGIWCSPKALPMEPWGTLGGGYDGNYGLDNCVSGLVYLAELTGDNTVREQAKLAISSSAPFLFPSPDDSGYQSWRKEEVISTRIQNWPGRVSYLGDGLPYAASPLGLNHPVAQRFTQLSYQANDTMALLASSNAHYVDSVGYALLNLDSYEAALLAPATAIRAPMETGQPDFAFADPVGCTVAAQTTLPNGDFNRLYMELQWRRGFTSSTVRNLTTANVNDIARVHFTTPTIDRVVTMAMQSAGGFGGLYSCHYGPFFVAMNLNSTTPAACTMPVELWGKCGKNLVTGAAVVVPSNGLIQVAHADPLVFIESAEPVITSAAAVFGTSGMSANLSVAAVDNGGAGNLIYTWSSIGTPPAPVVFTPNGTSANNVVAAFTKAGVYQLQVAVSNSGGLVTSRSMTVVVESPPFLAEEYEAPGIQVQGDTLLVATRSSVIGHHYQIQTCADLTAGSWADLPATGRDGTGNVIEFRVDRSAGESRRFYRIVIGR